MIGDKIKQIRLAQGISKSELARRVNVTPTAVHSWEEYRINPRPMMLPLIAQALSAPVAALTGEADAKAASVSAQTRRERLAAIASLKQQVAALYDTTADKIELLIKL